MTIDNLTKLVSDLDTAQRAVDDARWELKLGVRQCVLPGVPQKQIANTVGISRQTIHVWVNEVDEVEEKPPE